MLISSLPRSPYEKEENLDTYPQDTAIKLFAILPVHDNLRHVNYPTYSLDKINSCWQTFFKIHRLRPQSVGGGGAKPFKQCGFTSSRASVCLKDSGCQIM